MLKVKVSMMSSMYSYFKFLYIAQLYQSKGLNFLMGGEVSLCENSWVSKQAVVHLEGAPA